VREGNLKVISSGGFKIQLFRFGVVKRARINRIEREQGNDIFAIGPRPGVSATPLAEFLGHIGCRSCHIRLGSAKGLLRGTSDRDVRTDWSKGFADRKDSV